MNLSTNLGICAYLDLALAALGSTTQNHDGRMWNMVNKIEPLCSLFSRLF